jgi:peptide/nickel transport system permease protein
MLLLVFYFNLGWFPNSGTYPTNWAIDYESTGGLPPKMILGNLFNIQIALPSLLEIQGRLLHLFLPTLTLTLFSYGGYLLLTRATMMEALSEDYIVTAKAKGLKERTILFKHALKNASLPLITNVALTFGFILSGAIITEQVFSYPGLGHWTWLSISYRDFPALQAIFFLIALCVIVANFVADILYGVVDPRIKYG